MDAQAVQAWDWFRAMELASFLAVIVGVPLALWQMRSSAKEVEDNDRQERFEAAQMVYREVDERFFDFVKLCIQYPRLNCYSVDCEASMSPLTAEEKIQQKFLYTALTDLFEVAYVEYAQDPYNDEIRKLFRRQWEGWENYMRKFLTRPAYAATWKELRDEYDTKFAKFMDSLASSAAKPVNP